MEDWTGKTLSKVRIERLFGRGGMADVYLGQHVTLERPMAIKILHAHITEDPDLNRRFKEEAQAVAACGIQTSFRSSISMFMRIAHIS